MSGFGFDTLALRIVGRTGFGIADHTDARS
jgi:hypothetical protein